MAKQVVIVGGGHNGLVAAAYLARAGFAVRLAERSERLGGAVASAQIFPGVPAKLSRYSYLVSLLPQVITTELGLDLPLRTRKIASYTPDPAGRPGILVDQENPEHSAHWFRTRTGSDSEFASWVDFYAELAELAQVVAPTLTQPLPPESTIAEQVNPHLWQAVTQRPIGELIEARFSDDLVRGIVTTDALIGFDTWAQDPTLRQNRCFLYHVIGNGNGLWRVPVGGMGAVAAELERSARAAGAQLHRRSTVTKINATATGAEVILSSGERWDADLVLANSAPQVLAGLLGEVAPATAAGAQTKINLVLKRLPKFPELIDPQLGFAGTLHVNQGYHQLQAAYAATADGRFPDPLPLEVYCHTLTDPSILGPELAASGAHTLTIFALHTPTRLFRTEPERARERVRDLALASLQSVLAEPLVPCLARDSSGAPCLEVMSPLDIETELAMPEGNIFHGDLSWPWLPAHTPTPTDPAARWGVATGHRRVWSCGSGATRGGAVSGLGGHNAARAVCEFFS